MDVTTAAQGPGPSAGLGARVGDAIDRNVRIRIDGAGPLTARELVPLTSTAKELLASQPGFEQAVRGVLYVVEDAAAGMGIDPSDVRMNGIALAADEGGHGGNVFAANADDDPVFAGNFASADAAGRRDLTMALLRRSAQVGTETHATTSAGWLNLGPTASNALYGAATGTDMSDEARASAARTIAHEAIHLADHTRPSQENAWLREALAEVQSTDAAVLRDVAEVTGLGRVAEDALLAAASSSPYEAERTRLLEAARSAGMSVADLDAPSAEVERSLGAHLG